MLVRLCSKSFKLHFSSTWEFPDVWAGFKKDRGTRDQIANIHWITENAKEFQKNMFHWLCKSLWLCGSQQTGKFLEMGIPDHLTCLLRNLYECQEASIRTLHGMNGSKLGKEYKAVCLSPCLFNLYADYIMRNAGLDELQAGIKIAGRNINNFRYADDTTLMAESEEELRASWWGWRRRMEKLA